MVHAYTPGLKVLPHIRVRRVRQLPLKGTVHLRRGEWVEPHTIVASTSLPGNVRMVNVAGLLGVAPEDTPECLTVEVGSSLKAGQLMAESPGLFGFFKSRCNAPCDGVLESISPVTGQAVVREPPIPVEVDGYISGRVVEILADEGLVVETEAALVQGIFGIGGENRGELTVVGGPDEPLEVAQGGPELKGKVVVGGFLSLQGYRKAAELGIAAVVVGGFNYHDLAPILGYTLGVAITGSEDLATVLIVTEGFGRIPMAHRTFELLQQHCGALASVNGATQIRAGVIRPEIVIPLSGQQGEERPPSPQEGRGVDLGSLVRIIRPPYFGLLGRVTALPVVLQPLATEASVRVARVRLDTGEEIVVPRANLELVEMD